ncbi:hypothetical protein DPMN_018193 [Dreissena polymorpha]|uniref:Uncharacterized protein n=1 Tax=Dreissena polymorpha TaxID=45954 RepID=A0A9D4NG43_DREPO|nr:hypothetical protein DPMN_018193 [Dreissena polymorpha]
MTVSINLIIYHSVHRERNPNKGRQEGSHAGLAHVRTLQMGQSPGWNKPFYF